MDIIVRKLKQLHQSVLYHDKFADKFDAISLASINIDAPIPEQVSKLEFKSLQRLSTEVLDILNEGCISQQSLIINVQRHLELCDKSLLTIKASNSNGIGEADILSLDSDSSHSEDDLGGNRKRLRSNTQNLEETLLATDLHKHLRQFYESITESMEAKVLTLRLLHEVVEHYHQTIIDIATANGVLVAEKRAHYVIPPRVIPLLKHKLLYAQEEERLLQRIRKLWAEAVLGNTEFSVLADVDLNLIMQRQKNSTFPTSFHAKIGAVCILLLWSISECYNNEYMGHQIWQDPTFAVFMCFGDLLLLLLMWGVSMHIWKRSGIDYIRLLDLQHTEIGQSRAPVSMVLQSFANVALIFLVTFIVFNKAMRNAWQGYLNIATVHAIPVIFALFFLWRMVQPFETRKQWLYILWKVLAAPFYSVDFCAGYVGDLLTSLVRVSVPFVFSLMYVVISIVAWMTNHVEWAVSTSDKWWSENKIFTMVLVPVLTLLPLWIRLVQCLRRSVETGQRWPHFGNALKYTSAMAVIAHGTFQPHLRQHPVWILSFVGATIFQFAWDVFQDWGMLEISWVQTPNLEKKSGFSQQAASPSSRSRDWWTSHIVDMRVRLRNKRMLGPVWMYIAVMCFNLALRFAWTLTLLPADPNPTTSVSLYTSFMRHVGPVVAAAEIVRRMVWGFFRLEWEQITLIQKLASTGEKDLEKLLYEQRKARIEEEQLGQLVEVDTPLLDLENCTENKSSPKQDEDDDEDDDSEIQPLNIDMNGDIAIDPYDWTLYLPRDLLNSLYHCSSCLCVTSWEAKLRFIESLVFAGAVLLVLFIAAYPAFTSY